MPPVSDPMRIAVFHNLPSGGAKRALLEWSRRLSVSHEIDVYTLSTANHTFCDIRPFVRKHRVYDFTPRRLFRSPWGRLNQWQRWRDIGDLTRLGFRIAQDVSWGDYDVVFAHPCLYTAIPSLLQFVGLPSVYYLHEPFGRRFQRAFERPYLQASNWQRALNHLDPFPGLYNRRLDKSRFLSVGSTGRLLANSRFTQEEMKLQYEVDAPVCRYGVNIEDFYVIPGTRKGDYVISVGELTPRKGFDFLIRALSHVAPEHRPALKLISNWVCADERGYLESLAQSCEVDLRILMDLDGPQLALQYNRALLCVYSPIAEPLGLVPLEAMACGTPVIGVAEGGVRETIRQGETGLLTARDPREFADAVLELLTKPTLAEKLGRQGVEYVREEWNWEDSVGSLESHLRAVATVRA